MKLLFRAFFPAVLGSLMLRANPEVQLELGNGVSMLLVEVVPGKFLRGSPAEEANRGTDESQGEVTVSRAFLIGKTPVTVGQWERFVAETGYRTEAEKGSSGGFGWNGSALVQNKSYTWRNPGFPQTDDHPVCIVTFADSQAFCAWLERKSRRQVALPTEAQWEYACRAGTSTPWHTGTTPADGEQAAWHKGNAGNTTHPVTQKTANPWGLIIGGNVSEWCLDWYGPYPAGAAADPMQMDRNLSDKPRRVLRGGSWNRDLKNTRSAARWRSDPGSRNADVGFRVLCSTEVMASPPAPPPPAPPKVELEPGASAPVNPAPVSPLPEPVQPPSVPQFPPAQAPSAGPGILKGLLCLLVPVGLGILLIRSLIGHGKPRANPFVAPLDNEPEPPQPASSPIRKTNDGFWIRGPWPMGSTLRLRYVVAGALTETELIYRPGPDGHFVFTGTLPDSVSVVSDDGTESMLPPPLMPTPTPSPWERDDERPVTSLPPRFPSAY